MLDKVLNRIFVPERKEPEIIRWSQKDGDEVDESWSAKTIKHAGLTLDVGCGITHTNFVVPITVDNDSGKSVALGASGIGIALTYQDGTKRAFLCHELRSRGAAHAVLTVEGYECCQMSAKFAPGPLPVQVEATIQVNRFFASPILFLVPFKMDWGQEVRDYALQPGSPFAATGNRSVASEWPTDLLSGKSTVQVYRNSQAGTWEPRRALLHNTIVERLLTGKRACARPTLCLVTGGPGCGKSTLIRGKFAQEQPDAVVIDADKLWLEIPEYQSLANTDWTTAGDRTYAEVRYLRDELLAEAAARKLNIILETPGEHFTETLLLLKCDGYEVALHHADCPVEVALKRMQDRATHAPTPEDNLWGSPERPDLPDKYEYQNVDPIAFRAEYLHRKKARR